MLVEAIIAGDKTMFLFGSREVAGDSDLEVYSEKSPIGTAVHGKKAGDKLSYTAPNGRKSRWRSFPASLTPASGAGSPEGRPRPRSRATPEMRGRPSLVNAAAGPAAGPRRRRMQEGSGPSTGDEPGPGCPAGTVGAAPR